MKRIKLHLQKSTERMYHMPGPINRHKRKRTGIPYRPNLPTINVPRPQLLVSVVRANVNDHFHATVQQGGNVVLSGMELIHCIEECCVDVVTTGEKLWLESEGSTPS